jgi:hypothetical protein
MLVQFAVSPSGYWTGIIPFFKLYQDTPGRLATQDEGQEETGESSGSSKKETAKRRAGNR